MSRAEVCMGFYDNAAGDSSRNDVLQRNKNLSLRSVEDKKKKAISITKNLFLDFHVHETSSVGKGSMFARKNNFHYEALE